jgi:hypothetical protein
MPSLNSVAAAPLPAHVMWCALQVIAGLGGAALLMLSLVSLPDDGRPRRADASKVSAAEPVLSVVATHSNHQRHLVIDKGR